ncbi:MAG: amino acid permease [Sporocytophaga sp.]|uniref:APC family permease n=1 Tax=Sporocytophaga sp. TaxID=2231183 RepID=UPI001B1A7FF3|nr:APC family permease [Sporocytophaga sp.]MBO9702612.1 amino acid permease [Sporocytophaga sp.]
MFKFKDERPNIKKVEIPVKQGTITTFGISMMTCACVLSLRGLPVIAKEELTMFFYIGFSTLLFLIPVSLVSAELGGAFGDRAGGVYTWVGEAFNKRTGFIAIWLEWAQTIVLYPTVLGFASGAFAYALGSPSLASNGMFVGVFSIFIYWVATFIVFRGSAVIQKVTSYGFLLGTVIPGLLIIGFGSAWMIMGEKIAFLHPDPNNVAVARIVDGKVAPRIFPYFNSITDVAFLAGIVLLFSGVESQAVHANELKNPAKQFPQAMLLAALIIFSIFTLGALSVGAVVPGKEINVQSGLMQAFYRIFNKFHLGGLTYISGFLVTFGAVASVLSWLSGPSKGLLVTSKDGILPDLMSKTNAKGIQTGILYFQGLFVTILASLYIFLEDVNIAFFLLTVLTVGLYLIMYMLMYAAAIRLKYTHPNLPRSYKVPGGNTGMLIVAGVGFLAVLFAFVLAFVPPSQLPIGSPASYVGMVIGGTAFFTGLPFLIFYVKKKRGINLSGKPNV